MAPYPRRIGSSDTTFGGINNMSVLETLGVKPVFTVEKAEKIHIGIVAAKANGKDPEGLVPIAIKLTLDAMGVRNAVADGIAKRNSQFTEETVELNTANTETTAAEEIAESNLIKQIEMLRKTRARRRAEANAQIEENTGRIEKLKEETVKTNELSIYA